MIATRNRASDLRRTCEVLRQLSPPPLEVLITADGCRDDTVKVAKREAPNARLFINDASTGSVASRDRMMREAAAGVGGGAALHPLPEPPAAAGGDAEAGRRRGRHQGQAAGTRNRGR